MFGHSQDMFGKHIFQIIFRLSKKDNNFDRFITI